MENRASCDIEVARPDAHFMASKGVALATQKFAQNQGKNRATQGQIHARAAPNNPRTYSGKPRVYAGLPKNV